MLGPKRPARLTKLIGSYVRTNREIYNVVKHRPHAVVHYEQLVQRPEHTLMLSDASTWALL